MIDLYTASTPNGWKPPGRSKGCCSPLHCGVEVLVLAAEMHVNALDQLKTRVPHQGRHAQHIDTI